MHGALGSLNAWKLLLPVDHSCFCPAIARGGERFRRAADTEVGIGCSQIGSLPTARSQLCIVA